MSESERKRRLWVALQDEIAVGGRIETQNEFAAVVVYGKKINHILHLLLCFCTFGLWSIVWFFQAVLGGEKRGLFDVDLSGQINATMVDGRVGARHKLDKLYT